MGEKDSVNSCVGVLDHVRQELSIRFERDAHLRTAGHAKREIIVDNALSLKTMLNFSNTWSELKNII